VEFGVVREGDDIKAFGAGILSSFGELQHMAAGKAQLEPLDVFAPQPKMSYKVRRRHLLKDSKPGAAGGLDCLACCHCCQCDAVGVSGLVQSVRSVVSCACMQDGYQKRYFALDSFTAGAEQLKAYCSTLHNNIPADVRASVGMK
jgi:hypothetical protein